MIGNNVYGGEGYKNIPYINRRADVIDVESGISITSSIYGESGEILLALVMFRDVNEITTPNGWTKIVECDDFVSTTTHHKMAFFKYNCSSDNIVSVTFNQTTADRMQLILVSLNNVSDIIYDNRYDIYHTGTSESSTTKPFYNIPQKQSENDYIIYGATSSVWRDEIPYGNWIIEDNKLEIISIDQSIKEPRLCLINNILGYEQYNIKPTPKSKDISFALLGVKIISNF